MQMMHKFENENHYKYVPGSVEILLYESTPYLKKQKRQCIIKLSLLEIVNVKYVTSGTKCETWRFLTNRHEVLH